MKLSGILGRIAPAMTLAFGLALAVPAGAQTQSDIVTLKSFDGFTQLRGRLVEFDGSRFTIETSLGVIQIDALKVNCEGDACPANLLFGAEFAVVGSNTVGADLMPALIEGYSDGLDAELIREMGSLQGDTILRIRHQNGQEMAAIDLKAHGSGTAFEALAAGETEIAMAARQAKRADVARLVQAGLGDPRDNQELEHVIAVDGLLVLVNPANPLGSISMTDLGRVFSGQIDNWSALGGPDQPITVYSRDEESGTFQSFSDLVLAPTGLALTAGAERLGSNAELSDRVSADPGGIGFASFAYQRAAKALAIREECGLVSHPTPFAVKTEEYPLSSRLYLYTSGKPMSAHASKIVEFAKSDEAQPLIADAGFINNTVESLPIDQQGARLIHALTGEDEVSPQLLREMLVELRDAERLSITFRFSPGTSNLTPKSQADARQFARSLADGAYADREVLLVGFTDSIGQFALNQSLALRRASVVEQLMRTSVGPGELDGAQLSVRGYGELTPVGCNSTFGGRFVNRRVEVWVRARSGT